MVHLIVHLVRKIKLCGLVFLRWISPFERYMKILKRYVKSHNRPERCIVECYIYEKVIEFCSEYLINIKAIELPKFHFITRKDDNNKTGQSMVTIS